jgi:hypothetical protein
MVMAIGPAGEIPRLAGDRAAHLHEPVQAARTRGLCRAGLAQIFLGGAQTGDSPR